MSELLTLITSGKIHPSPESKIIRAPELAVLLEASQILQRAQEEIAEFRLRTEEEATAIKKQAYDEGFQEGLTQFNEHILALENEKKQLRHEMNQLILPLVLKATQKVIAGEIQTHPETIVNIVLQALGPVMQHHHVVIYVNKADKEILEDKKSLLKERFEQLESLSIEEREDVSPGGAIIKTDKGIVNMTIEKQVASLETAFQRYLSSLPESSPS